MYRSPQRCSRRPCWPGPPALRRSARRAAPGRGRRRPAPGAGCGEVIAIRARPVRSAAAGGRTAGSLPGMPAGGRYPAGETPRCLYRRCDRRPPGTPPARGTPRRRGGDGACRRGRSGAAGRLVGRLDPKVHRDRGVLEVKKLGLEPGFERSRAQVPMEVFSMYSASKTCSSSSMIRIVANALSFHSAQLPLSGQPSSATQKSSTLDLLTKITGPANWTVR